MPAGSCCTRVGCMSMTDTGVGANEPDPGEQAAIASELPQPRVEAPIVPKATIAGRALIAVIAIMTFLASITIGAVMLLRAAAGDWQAELAREVTIQVRPVAGRDIEADIAKAAAIAGATRGVAGVRPYSKQESTQLLQPWLGGLALDELPVPRLVAVAIAAGGEPALDMPPGAPAEPGSAPRPPDPRRFLAPKRGVTRT